MTQCKYTRGKRVHWHNWKIGGVYFRENGTAAFRLDDVVSCASWNTTDEINYKATYIWNGPNDGPEVTDTKTYLIEAIVEGEDNMTKLYEIKDDLGNIQYGHKLAKNSAGQWVMEVKGTGKVITADPKDIEEVLPYTIDVNFEEGGMSYSYTSEAGVAAVGDLFVVDGHAGRAIVKVTGVDTKSKSATKEFKPLGKLMLDKG